MFNGLFYFIYVFVYLSLPIKHTYGSLAFAFFNVNIF